jgi:hypothetical protein
MRVAVEVRVLVVPFLQLLRRRALVEVEWRLVVLESAALQPDVIAPPGHQDAELVTGLPITCERAAAEGRRARAHRLRDTDHSIMLRAPV